MTIVAIHGKECADPGRGPGRPKALDAEARESLILDAMERVLVARGLPGATMAAIAREAGMSKRTLYEVFENRDVMFEACVRRLRTKIMRPVDTADQALPLEERLRRILMPDARDSAMETPTAVLRAVAAEASRHPDLARAFLREGPHVCRRVVRDELSRATARGEVRIADCDAAARLLCDMAYDSLMDRMIDPDATPPDPARVDRRLRFAIRTFLGGIESAS